MAGFAEVIYSQERGYHRTLGANNHLHIGWPEGWSREQVAKHARQIARKFGLTINGQCRRDGYVPPGGSRTSLHFVSNGCRAVDFDTQFRSGSPEEDRRLLRAEAWARSVTNLEQDIDVAFTSFSSAASIDAMLRDAGRSVAYFTGGIVTIGLGLYLIAKDQGIDLPNVTSAIPAGRALKKVV